MDNRNLKEKILSLIKPEKKPALTLDQMIQNVSLAVHEIQNLYDKDLLSPPKQTAKYHDITQAVHPYVKNEKSIKKGLSLLYRRLIGNKIYALTRSILLLDLNKENLRTSRALKGVTRYKGPNPANELGLFREENFNRHHLLKHLRAETPHSPGQKVFYGDNELFWKERDALTNFFIELKKFHFLEARLNELNRSKLARLNRASTGSQ